jgi:hypothetical protein
MMNVCCSDTLESQILAVELSNRFQLFSSVVKLDVVFGPL